jgi:adenosylcobyric acid synthase
MVQGTASSVGKSLLVTALCRLYAQAEAARATPCADMNPILLKPEGLSSSQVVVMGRPIGSFHFRDYHARKLELRGVVGDALDRLRAANDLVILEGAGSPAEVNLKDRDLVNMWVAERADARVVLVTDIERGGALAALVGTLELLDPGERARVGALVINKFRGDPSLFEDGARFLERRAGVRVAGVVPHLGDAGIASEDSLDLKRDPRSSLNGSGAARVAIVRLPRLSNFDEFEPLERVPDLEVRWCERPAELDGARLVILPGTKCTVHDLAWLRATGLAGAIVERATSPGGGAVLGVCGGFQMMGERLLDPSGVESETADAPGLGLLPVVTRFEREKVTTPARLRLGEGLPLLERAGGALVDGYEIHCGRVTVGDARPFARVAATGAGEGAVRSNVAGTLVHGLFENAAVREALAAALGVGAGADAGAGAGGKDAYDLVADHFGAALDLAWIDRLAGIDT